MDNSRQRIAVVTGGSSGIGFATAKRLLSVGFRVAFFGQSTPHVREAAAKLGDEFGHHRVYARCVDIKEAHEVVRFFRELEGAWGHPDTLICNAGISPKGPDGATEFADLSLAEWNDVLSVNLTGTMLCCQAVVPAMTTGRFGRIILISSIAGRTVPKIAGTAYVTSKAALAGLSRSLVAACAGTGVIVNIVAPGRIITEMTGAPDSEVNRIALKRIPAGRLGAPDDITAIIEFLASENAGFINGATIDVNGGEFAPL